MLDDSLIVCAQETKHNTLGAMTILPKSLWWLGEGVAPGQQQILLGRESLGFMGLPINRMDAPLLARYSESFFQDLAGNAYCGMWVASFLTCMVVGLPWKPPAMSSGGENIGDALTQIIADDADYDEVVVVNGQMGENASPLELALSASLGLSFQE